MAVLNSPPASSGSSGGNIFGSFGQPSSTTSSGGGLFGSAGATTSNTSSSSLFGSGTTQGQSMLFGASSQTPSKPDDTTGSKQAGTGGLFGKALTGTTPSLFGSNTATPGPSGGSTLFGNQSTTPAGPPPQASATGQSKLQLGDAGQKQGGLFGSTPQQTPMFSLSIAPTSTTSSLTSTTKDKSTESAAQAASTSTPKPLFGGTAQGPQQNTQTSSLFKMPSSSGTDSTSKPAFPSLGTASTAQPTFSLFGSAPDSTTTPSSTSTATQPSLNLFGGSKTTTAATLTPATTATSATSGAASTGLFGKPAGSAESSQPQHTSTTTTSTGSQATTVTAGPSKSTATAAPGQTATSTGGGINLGASTTGPAPPAQSRLKNKTMDEIITRWATDLTKYQKDFREQAERVAEWDRMVVENANKLQKLYGSTVDADRSTQEVERQLTSVESQQEELNSWLDRYEHEVNEMMSKQVGPGESVQGPDQERERTYKLAEKLSDRLDDLGKDLTTMIGEVNEASAALSKSGRADEPLSQIVRILNSHLSQLQCIDKGTSELQAKVTAAQKAGQSLSSRFGSGLQSSGIGRSNNAADDFYRSFMGRR